MLQVAERLRQQILGLYDRHLTEDGKGVRYGDLKQDQGFRCCSLGALPCRASSCTRP